jgi:hypothetical protein
LVAAAIAKTAAAQEATEERLQKLIDKVDVVVDRVTNLEKKKPLSPPKTSLRSAASPFPVHQLGVPGGARRFRQA